MCARILVLHRAFAFLLALGVVTVLSTNAEPKCSGDESGTDRNSLVEVEEMSSWIQVKTGVGHASLGERMEMATHSTAEDIAKKRQGQSQASAPSSLPNFGLQTHSLATLSSLFEIGRYAEWTSDHHFQMTDTTHQWSIVAIAIAGLLITVVVSSCICGLNLERLFYSDQSLPPTSNTAGSSLISDTGGSALLNDPEARRKLLLSHAITRLGTQGWFFVAALVLVKFTPGLLVGPAFWGLVTMIMSMLLGPLLGTWADSSNRKHVITIGVLVQFTAVIGSLVALLAVLAGSGEKQQQANFSALAAFTVFAVLEKLGIQLSDVSVKREWTPLLFKDDFRLQVNMRMSQIDLITEVAGPVIAGLLITVGTKVPAVAGMLPSSIQPVDFGFIAVGILNALSFWPQLALLLSIYDSHAEYLQPKPASELTGRKGSLPPPGAWSAWLQHPSGLQFLSVSYALCYLTVLSPHGALVTAHLELEGVPSTKLSLLRGAGALLGVLGATVRPQFGKMFSQRVADGSSIVWLASWVVVCLVAFMYTDKADEGTRSWMLSIFMTAMCLGRPGLYAFELGVMNEQQQLADARHRNAIGAVDAALTSAATAVMYGSGMVWKRQDQFLFLVAGSAFFLCCAAVVYLLWACLYHSQRHSHMEVHRCEGHGHGHEHGNSFDGRGHDHAHRHSDEGHSHGHDHGHRDEGHCHGHAHGHSDEGHCHGHGHAHSDESHGHGYENGHIHGHTHTQQQEEDLDDKLEHEHVYYNPPACSSQ